MTRALGSSISRLVRRRGAVLGCSFLAAAAAAVVAAALGGSLGCASSKERARARHEAAPWRPPGETLADSTLAVEAIQAIYRLDDIQGARCEMRRFVDTDLVGSVSGSPPAAGARWTERWTMDRCGKRVRFLVAFAPDPSGGTGVTARFE